MKAEYKSPNEWGKLISLIISIFLFLPMATENVVHSPTPSDVIIPGSEVELEVENLLNYFTLEIDGVKEFEGIGTPSLTDLYQDKNGVFLIK